MQGHCRYGKKGIGCSYAHSSMCFKFIMSGHKGCSKGDFCNYALPKICRSSLLSYGCDRVKCYIYHATGIVRPNLNQGILCTYKTSFSPNSLDAYLIIPLVTISPSATDTLAFPTQKSPTPLTRPYNVAAS